MTNLLAFDVDVFAFDNLTFAELGQASPRVSVAELGPLTLLALAMLTLTTLSLRHLA